MRLFVFVIVSAVTSRASALTCAMCMHGEVSTQPKFAPNSRIAFKLPTSDCMKESINCADTERHCISAVSKDGDTYSVHKGCVDLRMWRSLRSRFDDHQFCTKEIWDTRVTATFPIGVNERVQEIDMCVCDKNLCNADADEKKRLDDGTLQLTEPDSCRVLTSSFHTLLASFFFIVTLNWA